MSMQSLRLVCKALRSPRVRDFTKSVLKRGYTESFSVSEQKVNSLIESAFVQLTSGQESKISVSHLLCDAKYCNAHIYKLGNNNFWFNKSYSRYKNGTKDHSDIGYILPYIEGKKILDFGSGSGFFASLVAQQGYQVWGIDRLSPSEQTAGRFFFHRMRTPTDISCGGNKFHTVISRSVLHHIQPRQRLKVLHSLSMCTKQRLLIKEEVYGQGFRGFSQSSRGHSRELLTMYSTLTTQEQLLFLALMDFYGNVVAQGLTQMSMPFSFLQLDQWETLLRKFQFRILKKIPVIFQKGSAHNSAHVWLICEKY